VGYREVLREGALVAPEDRSVVDVVELRFLHASEGLVGMESLGMLLEEGLLVNETLQVAHRDLVLHLDGTSLEKLGVGPERLELLRDEELPLFR
jgi:hypothetical protein